MIYDLQSSYTIAQVDDNSGCRGASNAFDEASMSIFKEFFVCCAGSAPLVAPVAQRRWVVHLQAAKPKQRQRGEGESQPGTNIAEAEAANRKVVGWERDIEEHRVDSDG